MRTNPTLFWFLIAAMGLAVACGDDDDTSTPDSGVPDSGLGDGGTPMPRGAGNPPTLGAQIDRMGRPAINTALTETFNGDDTAKAAAKNAYNEAGPSGWADFQDEFEGSLAVLDALDAVCGNQLLASGTPVSHAALAEVLVNDQLYLDSSPDTCDGGEYLGVEAEFVGALGAGAGGCGGRDPNDDVIDRSYSVLANGSLGDIGDTIDADDATHDPDTFPWLADPQ